MHFEQKFHPQNIKVNWSPIVGLIVQVKLTFVRDDCKSTP